jgi:filamentous hemagglutinin family protein
MSKMKRARSLSVSMDGRGQRFTLNRITAAVLISLGAAPAWADNSTNTITLHNAGLRTANNAINGLKTDTDTSVIVVNSNTVTITTATKKGGTAFNSFGDFNVATGNTVNMVVPDGASTLVNLVHDTATVINGNLNGVQGGSIGGHVIFADPSGMVVGASGVVNVGSLTVTTPSALQMQQLVITAVNGSSADGNKAATDLKAGTLNGGSGTLSIGGKINASGSINLFAAAATVQAGAKLNSGVDYADQVFRSTVNVSDAQGTGVVRQDGSVQIVANSTVAISGELSALMADNSGGSVSVKAGQSVTLNGGTATTQGGTITASGKANKAGGKVTIEAPSITMADYSTINTSTTGTGNAGDIMLTANSDSSVTGTDAATVDLLAKQLEDQAQPLLSSSGSKAAVVIGQHAKLDAGQASDATKRGSVSISAFGFDKQISGYANASGTINVDGQINAKDILLHANSEAMISNTLLGSLFSSAALTADFSRLKTANGWTDEETWANIVTTLGDASSSKARNGNLGALGLDPTDWSELAALIPNITVAIANANASVSIGSTATLKASGAIDIAAKGTRTVDTSTGTLPGLSGNLPFNLGISYGRISGETSVNVADGASLTSGGNLAIQALSADTLKLVTSSTNSNNGNGTQNTTAGFAFGMAHSDVTTLANVAHGVLLNVAQDTSVTAVTEQTLSNDVTFKSLGLGAIGGPAIALTLFDSTTRAVFDADLAGGRNLSVTAVNLVDQQKNSATVQSGNSDKTFKTAKLINTTAPISGLISAKLKAFFNLDPATAETKPTESTFRFGSAVAVGIADHTAEAVVGSRGSAPKLALTGDLTVQALQRENDLHNSAQSSVMSKADLGDSTETALSVAAAYNQLTLNTHALIGDGVVASAARLGVGAVNQQLLNLDGVDRWSSLSDIFAMLVAKGKDASKLPSELSTNFANGVASGTEKVTVGSVTVMLNNLDATAWVGDNVKLTATGTDASAWSNSPLAGLATLLGADGSETASSKAAHALAFNWDSPLAIQAHTDVQQLQISGNLWPSLSATATGDDGTSAGGAVNVQVTGNKTVAGIGASGAVTAKAVNVSAQQEELIIGISPSGGKGASAAGNGAVVVSVNNAKVNASINNSTAVTADNVTVSAAHQVGMWSAAGAIALSQNNGVGASVAVNVLNSDVEALVGANPLWRPSAMGVGSTDSSRATWSVDNLLINSRSDGQAGAFALAGARAKTADEKTDQAAAEKVNGGASNTSTEMATTLSGAVSQTLTNGLNELTASLKQAQAKASSIKDSVMSVPSTLSGYVDKLKMLIDGTSPEQGSQEGSSFALAGSAALNVSRQTTRSSLGDIVLDPRDPNSVGSNVTVQALNQTNQLAGAGGGALTSAGEKKSESSTAMAGAFAFDYLGNTTEALLQNATLRNNHALAVHAITAGDQLSMGLGMSAATGGVENTSGALAASAAAVTNATRAAVIDSTVSQKNRGSIDVAAYDRSRLLIGGGAFAGSTGKGSSVGVSATVGVLANKIQAQWLGSTADGFVSFDLAAVSATRVLAGALTVAASTGGQSSAGAGALFALVLNNVIEAKVDADPLGVSSSLTGGTVDVSARSASNAAALDALIDSAGDATLAGAGLDLDGTATAAKIDGSVASSDNLTADAGDTTTTQHTLYDGGTAGESIIGIAGGVAGTAGTKAAGGAFGVVYTGSDYTATVANTDADLTGDLNITAQNDTKVVAAAVGAAGSSGTAVSGSSTAVIGRGNVTASLDMNSHTLHADNLTVSASKTAGTYSLAGNIAASSGGNAVGAAVSLTDMQQGASATVSHGAYRLSGDATVTAAGQSKIMTAAIAVAATSDGNAVGGAITYNRISDTTKALLNDVDLVAADLLVNAGQSGLGARIDALAVNVALASGGTGLGGALAVNLIDATRSAKLTDSQVAVSGNANLSSSLDGEIWGIGVNGVAGTNSGGGSVVVNNISGGDTVGVDDSTLSTTGTNKAFSANASGGQGLKINSLAGAITGGSEAAVGGAISVNRIAANRTASLTDTDISGFASNSLKSGVDQRINAIAVAGSVGNNAGAGSSTTNILSGTEEASISGGSVSGGSLSVTSNIGDRTLWSLAGAIAGAGEVAVGIANANNIITSTREAAISHTTLTLSQALDVKSGGSATIRTAAVGAGVAGNVALGGSVAVNVISGTENATLDGVTLTGATSVTVDVSRGEANIQTLAGNVQGAGTGAGATAIAVSTVNQQRNALINNSSLSLGSTNSGIRVNALTSGTIKTLALSGAGAGTGAAVLSSTTNSIDAVTHASVSGSSGSASSLNVTAKDTSAIDSLAGGAVAAGSIAVGVAVAVNRIANDIEARLSGNLVSTGWALNDLNVTATSDAKVQTASVSAGFSGTAAVNAGVTTNLLNTSAKALIDGGAKVVAQNNIGVIALDRDVIRSYAAVVSGSGNAAVSGLVAVNLIDSSTEAGISGGTTSVTALGNGNGLAVDNGTLSNAPDTSAWALAQQFSPAADLVANTETLHGLAVRATSLQQVGQVSLSAGVALTPLASAAVTGLSNTSIIAGDTLAYIDDASINGSNSGANAAQQVSIGAASHSFSYGSASSAALSLGVAAVAASVDTGVVSRNVTARINHAAVTSLGATDVSANSTQSASNLVATISGGIVGVAGGAAVLELKGSTQALVGNGSSLNVGALKVAASAINDLSPNAGTLSGGGVAVGAGINIGYDTSTVRAWLGEVDPANLVRTAVNSSGAVNVTADSKTTLRANAVGASLGGVAVAGASNILIVENTTEAGGRYVDFGTSAQRTGSVNIKATDSLDAQLNVGSLAGGGVAVGGSANVLVTNNATRAELLDSTAWLTGLLNISALRTVDADLHAVTGGISAVSSIGGALSLLLLGSGTVEQDGHDAMGELDKGNNGTLSLADNVGSRKNADTAYTTTTLDANGNVTLVDSTAAGTTLDSQTQTRSVKDRFVASSSVKQYKQETVARLSNATVNTAGDVTVSASDLLATTNLAGSAQVSGATSYGAAAAFTFSNAHVAADVLGGSLTAASLNVTGNSGALTAGQSAVDVTAYNGAAGMGLGLGAALAIGVMNNSVASHLGGVINLTGSLKDALSDSLEVSATAIGASVGAVGAGVVVAVAERNSDVNLKVDDNASLSAQTVSLSSSDLGRSSASGNGAAGGLLGAGNAVVVTASDSSTVTSTSGNFVTFNAGSGGVTLSASALPNVSASAIGAALGGAVGVGASVATASGDTLVTAALGDDNSLLGNNGLTLAADLKMLAGKDPGTANIVAKAIAGSGGLYFSANGTVATASNNGSVSATTGNRLQLPGGRIDISADSATHQYADALGIAVSGGLSVGVAVASATATTQTVASLGSNTQASSGVTMGDVVLSATGNDLNQAKSVAGSGGLIAGNASQVITRATGTASVSVGNNSNLLMDNLSLNASYTGRFGAHADSVNAALLGASGAGVQNNLTGNSTVTVGDGALLVTRQDMLISASNHFYTQRFDDTAVSGAGGGVISGQAVVNKTDITGNALVNIGAAHLVAGLAPTGSISGKLMVRAYSEQATSEDATLSTGGGIAGGGAQNDHTSTLNNTINVASGAILSSYGELGLGTYSLASAAVEALVSTWGVAGVGVANANVSLTSNQNVNVRGTAVLEALGNIAIDAGQDPEGLWETRMTTSANAQSVVRGLIAIPSARAVSRSYNNAGVTVDAAAQVLAARSITVGGFKGYTFAEADGVGRGYELGFIPVTNKDSTSDPRSTSTATLNGTLLAGRYHELVIDIDANGNLVQSSGLPVSWMLDTGFIPTAYLDGISGIDATTKQILRNTLASNVTGAIRLGSMMAAGGNITVQADSLSGSGSLTANGGPKIQVTNASSRYLLVGSALIPSDTGGNVYFTGGAGAAQFGASQVHEVNKGQRAQILIQNTWGGSSGNVSYGPAIFLTGDLYNLSGLIHITNAKGSLGQFASTYGQQVLVEIPEGSMSVYQPNAYWAVGSNPISEWSAFADITSSPTLAIEMIANAMYTHGELANNNGGLLYQSDNNSTVLFGGCLPASSGSGSNCGGGVANSYTGSSVGFHGIASFPVVPILTLQKVAYDYAKADLSGSKASGQIVGGQVGIQAKYVDINATISSGQATTRTLSINASLDSWLSNHYCASHTCTSLVDIPTNFLASTGGTLIHAKYDFVNQRIIVDDVNASGGGFVYIKGGVISTNQLGNIQVNNGYGQVTINNQSNAQLQVGNIDTGSGSIGIVQIVDTLKGLVGGQYATTWYVDTQGVGLSTYDNRNGATTLDGAYLVSSSAGNTVQYNPLTGIRYQWSQSASLYRNVVDNDSTFSVSNWAWSNPADIWTVDAGRVVAGNGNTSVYQRDVSGTMGTNYWVGVAYHGCDGGVGSECHYGFSATGQEEGGEWYGLWQYNFPTLASITVTQSVKADNPFNISFVGNAKGSITATSNNNLIVAGKLSNPVGTTTLSTNGNLTSLTDSSVYAHDLVLTAAAGIGATGSAFNASVADGGTLTATSGSAGTYLSLGSGALINSIKAGNGTGDVVINAVGDLLATSNAANRGADVVGRNITLNSSTGSLGSAANFLRLNAVEVATSGGASAFGVVNANANRNAYLEETKGDMWVGQITAATGDVSVKVDQGSLYDVGRRSSQNDDESAQQAIWQKLALTSGYGAESNITATSVKPFQDQITANYREYWSLVDAGSITNGTLTLSTAGLELYRPLAALKLGQLSASDADVRQYVSARYNDLSSGFDTQIGSNWRTQAAFQSYDQQFSYVATSAQITALSQDAVWTQGELLYAIDKAALGAASGSSVGSSQPNISGRNVNLQVADSLGQLAGALTIDFSALRNGTLTSTEAAALAVATAPGDVIVNRNSNNDIVSLTVNRTLAFYVNASGQFDLNAGGAAYLQSQPDLRIGNVTVGSDARLAANGSIVAASAQGGVFNIGNNLTLQSTSGSLGTAGTTPATLDLNVGGALLAASAGQDVAINWLSGNFNVNQIYALGAVYLNASSGSLVQQGSGVTVTARDITLQARDAIGSAGQAMQVELQSSTAGTLNATAGTNLWIATDKALTVGTVQAGNNLSLSSTSTAGMGADTLRALNGDVSVDTRGTTRLNTTQASGQVLVNSSGDVQVGQWVQAGGLAYLNAQGELSLDDGAQVKGANLQLHDDSLTLGNSASLSGANVALTTRGAANFGAHSHIDATGQLSLSNSNGGASGDLTLASGAILNGASIVLNSAVVKLAAAAAFNSSGSLGLTASSLTMAADSYMQAAGTLSLKTSGDMTLGRLTNSGSAAQVFVIDSGGQITANGDGNANLIATGSGTSTVHAGIGIGSAAQALWVNLPVLTSAITDQGNVYLRVQQHTRGSTLDARHGLVEITANGGGIDYANVHAQGDFTQHGGDLTAASLVVNNGNLLLDHVDNASITAGDINGLAHVTASSLSLGKVAVADTADLVVSGDMRVSDSFSALNTTLDLGSGSAINALTVTGDLDLVVTNALSLGRANVTGKAVLTHRGVAATSLHYGDLVIGDTLDVTGAGNWSGNSADVAQTATFNVGTAQLGSLLSRQGRLSLQARGLFAADRLTSSTQDVDLLSGSANLGAVNAATTINALTNGDLVINQGIAQGNITLHTVTGSLGDIRFGDHYADPQSGYTLSNTYIQSGNDVDMLTDGNVYGGNAVAAHQMHIIGRNMDIGHVQSQLEDVFLQATGPYAQGEGNITGLVVEAARDLSIVASGNLSMPTIKYGGSYSLKAGRDLNVGVGGDFDATGDAVAGRDMTFTIGGNIDLRSLTAGRNILVTSGKSINIDDGVTAGGNIRMVANGGDLTIGTRVVSTAVPYENQTLKGNVVLQASGNVTTPLVKATAGSITVSGQNLRINDLDAAGSTAMTARGLIQVNGTSRSGAEQTWSAAQAISFGQLLAGGAARLTAGADIDGTNMSAASITAQGQNLWLNDLTSVDSTDLTARGLIQVNGTSRSGGAQTWSAAGAINFGQLLAGGNAQLTAGGDITGSNTSAASVSAQGQSLRLNDLTSVGATDLLARGLIQVSGTSRSGGTQQWTAEQTIGFGHLLAQGQALLDSMLSTRGTELQADAGAVVNAGWRNGQASEASIVIDQARAPTMSLWSGNLISVADASIGQSVDLHGQDIAIYGQHTGSGQLNLWVGGSGENAAQRFDSRLTANDIVAPHYYAVSGKLVTRANRVDLQDAAHVDFLDLQTASAHVVADDLTPAYRSEADVQLYEIDKAFALLQEAVTSTTNAYVVHRNNTHLVLVPNFSEAHAPVVTGVMVQGVTASSYGEQNASGRAFSAIIKQLLQSTLVLPKPSQWTPSQWSNAPTESRINLNVDNVLNSNNGVRQWDL